MNRKDTSSNVVCLIDMDCFYCQVEEKLDPSLKGKPLAVVQYNAWQGGGIIAVNYAARDRGVTRHMRGDEAKKHCPEIELVKVPSVREKADLSKYREAGKEVAAVLQKFTSLLERASVDEAYLDITERVNDRLKLLNDGQFKLLPQTLTNTYAVGYSNVGDFVKLISQGLNPSGSNEIDQPDMDDDAARASNLKLLIGATIVNEIRARVKEETGYECSAGIAHNKILAKLTCGINKPNKQTVLPLSGVAGLFETLPVNKIRGLGGKFGEIVCENLKIKYMGDLLSFSERELQSKFDEKNGTFLYLICRGVDLEPVTPKYTSKSIGCCKRFPGKNAIKGVHSLNHWLKELATEIHDRLDKDLQENNRRAQLLTVSFMQTLNGSDVSSSRSIALESYDLERIAVDALECIKKNTEQFMCMQVEGGLYNPIKFLGLSVGKFEKISSNRNRIQEMFKLQAQTKGAKEKSAISVGQKEAEANINADRAGPAIENEDSQSKVNFFQKYFKKPTKTEDTVIKTEIAPAADVETPMEVESVKMEEPTVEENNLLPEAIADDSLKVKSVCDINVAIADLVPAAPLISTTTDMIKEDENNGSTSSIVGQDYTVEYAEYTVPQNINWDDYMKECPECNRKVRNYEFQCHMDQHFAFALSQQQRDEFRQDIQRKFQSKSSPKAAHIGTQRKIPKTSAPSSTSKIVPISKFLKKESEDEPQRTKGEQIICEECKRSVALKDFPEHSDYHYAQKVKMEVMRELSPFRVLSLPQPAAKRKSPQDTNSAKKRSIAAFFTQPK